MDNIFGSFPVSGTNFYGRDKFIRQLVNILISGNSFLLLGLRRTGKSSALAEVIRLVKEHDHHIEVVFLNCQTYKDIQDFYKELHLALPLSWREKFRKSLKESKRLPTKLIDYVTDHIEEVSLGEYGSIKLRNDIVSYSNTLREETTKFFINQEKKIVLCIDELPFLFETMSKSGNQSSILDIESILTTLRDWRNAGISTAICGSLNLHQQLEELGVSRKLLAGLTTQRMRPYTVEEAHGLLQELNNSSSIGLTDETINAVLKVMPDYIPQFIQYFFHILKSNGEEIDQHVIETLYANEVYPHLIHDFIYQFSERLKVYEGDDYETAKQILNYISKNQPVKQNDTLRQVDASNAYSILIKLMDYEFIQLTGNLEYSFSLNLLQQWWIDINL